MHETGARLTHDFKNMLQYLLGLISIAESQPEQSQQIMQYQLPVLAQRIELILEKLKVPEGEGEADAIMVPLSAWWQNLQQRHQYRNIDWVNENEADAQSVPQGLFDSVADNLIDNARNKRLREAEIDVTVSVSGDPLTFTVCDNGEEVSNSKVRNVLRTVVDSEDGLGIGLYQTARWAEQLGYKLALRENKGGRVCFQLTRKQGDS